MIDLHHHLLPGLDDGSPDLATSLQMARMAAEDGITHVACTPHASGRYEFHPEAVAARLAELRAALAAEHIPLTLGSACDFHLNYDNIKDAIAHPAKYTVNGGRYLMVELPDHGIPTGMGESLHELRVAGIVPILTHPERNPTLQADPERLARWMRSGLLTQVTSSSLLGQMGRTAESFTRTLIANRWVHFIATDAHNLTTRPPRMRAACERLAKLTSEAFAHRLCVENPRAVFENRELPEQDEPLHLYDEDEFIGAPWWKRLFRK